LVEACVRQSTHYCDITGEPHFIRSIIDKFHKEAQEKRVRIVNCCGFDSIPSDLGALLVAHHIKSQLHRDCSSAKYFLGKMKGGVSGGTIASAMNMFELPPAVLKATRDPLYLNPDNTKGARQPRDQKIVAFDEDSKSWTAPFVMALVNTRIVRRSNALLSNYYGDAFQYSEHQAAKSFFQALVTWLLIASVLFLSSIRFTRDLLKKVVPKPGEGPSEKQRNEGFFNIAFVAQSQPKSNDEKSTKVFARVKGVADPGYGETSKMVAEAAICLALDDDEDDDDSTAPKRLPGGVLTPASAMGFRLIKRLRDAGMTFEIVSSLEEATK